MKKSIALAFLLTFFAFTSFAGTGNEPTDKNIADKFTKIFASAQSVNWVQNKGFVQADFLLNGQYLSAYFTPDAKMAGVSRNLLSNDLPIYLMADLKINYEGYWISELFEYANPDSDTYYVTVENADKKLILKSNSTGFSLFKKSIK